jgi:cell division protein FtsB
MGQKRLKLVLIPLLLFMAVLNLKAIWDYWWLGYRTKALKTKLDVLVEEQKEITDRLRVATSSADVERRIRNELGWIRPGEQIVVISKDYLLKTETSTPSPVPNWRKWVRVVF